MTMRYDRVPIRAVRDGNGYITDTPVLTRTGVFLYRDQNGKERREYRSPEVVFAEASLAGYKGLPITDGHPGRVNSKNVKATLVGTVMTPGRADGDNLIAEIVIHDPAPVDAGRKELSVGYEVAFDETPGTSPEGERYDASQISIIPNHLALVSKGRAGTARLNLDAADADPVDPPLEEPTMIKVKIESTGIAYDAAPEVGQEVDRLRAELVAARKETETISARADSADADIAKMKAGEAQMRADAVAAVKLRMGLEAEAARLKCPIAQDASDRSVREAVVKAVRGATFNMDGKSDDYVAAAYDLAVSENVIRTDVVAESRKQMSADSADTKIEQVYSATSARDKYRAALRG